MIRIGSFLAQQSKNTFRAAASDLTAREKLFEAVIDEAISAEIAVLVLPAGFFRTSSQDAAEKLVEKLCTIVGHRPLLCAFGIDIGDAEKVGGKAEEEQEGQHLFLGAVIERGRLLIDLTAQIGVRTNDVSPEVAQKNVRKRIACSSTVARGARIGLLLCGEIQSIAWRSALQREGVDIVLHPAHASVQLDGASKESWRVKIIDLLDRLPDMVWAFADHVAAGQHLDSKGSFAALVRRRQGEAALAFEQPVRSVGEAGWLYAYDAPVGGSDEQAS